MPCSIFGHVAVVRSHAVRRPVPDGPPEKIPPRGSRGLASRWGAKRRGGGREYAALPERRVPAPEATVW